MYNPILTLSRKQIIIFSVGISIPVASSEAGLLGLNGLRGLLELLPLLNGAGMTLGVVSDTLLSVQETCKQQFVSATTQETVLHRICVVL